MLNMKFEEMTLGSRLNWLLQEKQMSQVALAKAIGISQAAISNIRIDDTRKPSAVTLMGIAEALNCNPNWLLDGKGDPWKWAPVTAESERDLLTMFRALTEIQKTTILALIRTM